MQEKYSVTQQRKKIILSIQTFIEYVFKRDSKEDWTKTNRKTKPDRVNSKGQRTEDRIRGKDVVQAGIYAIFYYSDILLLGSVPPNFPGILIFCQFNQRQSQTLVGEGNRWKDFCIPEQLERTRQQMLCFYFFYVFTPSFGGMVAQAGQRAKAKYLGFVVTTAGRNKPGSRSTSLKTQRECSRAFLALLPLSPSLHSPFCLSLHTQHTPSPTGNWTYEETVTTASAALHCMLFCSLTFISDTTFEWNLPVVCDVWYCIMTEKFSVFLSFSSAATQPGRTWEQVISIYICN